MNLAGKICPGDTDTSMLHDALAAAGVPEEEWTKAADIPLGRVARAEEGQCGGFSGV